MVTHEISLSFTVTPARIRLLLVLGLSTLLPRASSTADVSTMDLYYPPPVAAYDKVQVSGPTVLARDYGSVLLGANNAGGDSLDRPAPYIAIGAGVNAVPTPAFPAARLFVNGTMRVDGCISLLGGSSGSLNIWRCNFQ